jgi:hypothetical protein
MRMALDLLGFGPCHHMRELLADHAHRDLWRELNAKLDGRGPVPSWDALLGGYGSCVDWPSAAYWPLLVEPTFAQMEPHEHESTLAPEQPVMAAGSIATAALRALVDEADRYLATLPGPGVADVRAGVAEWREGPVTPAGATTANPVVSAHLPAALALLGRDRPALALAIAEAAPALDWVSYDRYPPAAIGAAFAAGHAYARIIGEGAAIPARDFDLGLFLIAPHVLYRDHHHPAPELYAPLTGSHGWRFSPGAKLIMKGAHEPVWNLPDQPHATKVGPVPFLCLYGWTQNVDLPAHVIPADDWPGLEDLRLEP